MKLRTGTYFLVFLYYYLADFVFVLKVIWFVAVIDPIGLGEKVLYRPENVLCLNRV